MSFVKHGNDSGTYHRKSRGLMSLAEVIDRDYRAAVPALLRQSRESAKVIALNVGSTPRSVENWREGLNLPQVPHFFALAKQIPELRKLALQWLDADNGNGDDPSKLANEITQFLLERGKR